MAMEQKLTGMGLPSPRRTCRTAAIAVVAGVALFVSSLLVPLEDQSDQRQNSLSHVASFVGLGTEPAAAAEGGVNFSGYCKSRYGRSATAVHAWTGAWTLVTWRCEVKSLLQMLPTRPARMGPPLPGGRCLGCRVITNVQRHGIDVNAVCRWQHGSRSYSRYVGERWSDWRCIY